MGQTLPEVTCSGESWLRRPLLTRQRCVGTSLRAIRISHTTFQIRSQPHTSRVASRKCQEAANLSYGWLPSGHLRDTVLLQTPDMRLASLEAFLRVMRPEAGIPMSLAPLSLDSNFSNPHCLHPVLRVHARISRCPLAIPI